jgi:hypothetical protein
MEIKTLFTPARSLLLSFILVLLIAGPGLAQAPAPLASLDIALWPEYDRPEVLVIYRATIADDVSLPTPVSFNLPKTVEAMYAVAYFDEERGTLVNVLEYDFIEGADSKVLSFTTPSRQIQFEYYSGDMLSIDGDARELTFSFVPGSDVADLTLELQQPTTAQAFTSDPAPTATEVREDSLVYALYRAGAMTAGDTFSLQASYTRSADQPSISTLGGVSIPSPEQAPVEVGGGRLRDNLGLILIVAGVLLLIGAFVYWFWSQRTAVVPEPAQPQASARRRSPSHKRRRPTAARSPRPPQADKKQVSYCHRCGTKFREGAQFCHACGAERRAE